MIYDDPPVFTIDLSLPPSQRYVDLALFFKEEIKSLTSLFDELVESFLPAASVKFVKGLARVALRRLHRKEENEEIKGICRATGVDFYLLVAFNVLLDLLMGCTSGAARIKDPERGETRMLHFRTLDWGMDELRAVVVQLKFVRSPSPEIIASSITYAGFVGVLTGVRKDLSLSLNFRPNHDTSGRLSNIRFYSHQLMILLGLRPSISSHLRQYLIPSRSSEKPSSLAKVVDSAPSIPTTACFIIVSDGHKTVTLEKDHRTAAIRSSTSFIVTTNHDVATSSSRQSPTLEGSKPQLIRNVGVADMIEESTQRRGCMLANVGNVLVPLLFIISSANPDYLQWERKVRHARQGQQRAAAAVARDRVHSETGTRVTRSRQAYSKAPDDGETTASRFSSSSSSSLTSDAKPASEPSSSSDEELDVCVTPHEINKWLIAWPITNECTHFAAVLDPAHGEVCWVRRFIEPVKQPDQEVPRSKYAAEQRKKRKREDRTGLLNDVDK